MPEYGGKMIYLFCAMYPEAAPLIKEYRMKRVDFGNGIRMWQKDNELTLVLTGTGQLNAAAVTAAVLSRMKKDGQDYLISYGCCASLNFEKTDGIFLAHKITDLQTGRDYYPDLLYETGFAEDSLISGSTVYTGTERIGNGELYDMESAAVFHAGSMFFPVHRMFFIRFISDAGQTENLTAATITALSAEYLPVMKKLVDDLVRQEEETDMVLTEEDDRVIRQLAEDMGCSTAMKHELYRYLHYAELIHKDWKKKMEEMYETGTLPVTEKEEGKKVLHAFREYAAE